MKNESRPERVEPFLKKWRAAVVPMQAHEHEEHAWRRYLTSHPEDIQAEVRIFHVC
jgi:hypothetical protein